jgi:hypothetical protein
MNALCPYLGMFVPLFGWRLRETVFPTRANVGSLRTDSSLCCFSCLRSHIRNRFLRFKTVTYPCTPMQILPHRYSTIVSLTTVAIRTAVPPLRIVHGHEHFRHIICAHVVHWRIVYRQTTRAGNGWWRDERQSWWMECWNGRLCWSVGD